jgi:hypothetical protein
VLVYLYLRQALPKGLTSLFNSKKFKYDGHF